MELLKLSTRTDLELSPRLKRIYAQFENVMHQVQTKPLTEKLIAEINPRIKYINAIPHPGKELRRAVLNSQEKILTLLRKELNLVPKSYYRNHYMAIGMTVFGLPIGIAFGTALHNMAFLGIGLPIGMALGIAMGTEKDKKAMQEGRQLNIEIHA